MKNDFLISVGNVTEESYVELLNFIVNELSDVLLKYGDEVQEAGMDFIAKV